MPDLTDRHELSLPLDNENVTRANYRALIEEIDDAIPTDVPDHDNTGILDGWIWEWDSVSGKAVAVPAPTGVTDHGALTGLADDDHPQYALDTDLANYAHKGQANVFSVGGQEITADLATTIALLLRRANATTTNPFLRLINEAAATLMQITASGRVHAQAGAVTEAGLGFAADTNVGFYRPGAGAIGLTTNGVARWYVNSVQFRMRLDQILGWSSGDPTSVAADVTLARIAAASLELTGALNVTGALTRAGNTVHDAGNHGSTGDPHSQYALDTDLRMRTVNTISGATTLTSAHDVVICTGTFTVTLPAVASNSGRRYDIKNKGSGVITIDPNAAEQIESVSSPGTLGANTTLAQGESVTIVCDGTQWWIL